jgi:hypothetical protein
MARRFASLSATLADLSVRWPLRRMGRDGLSSAAQARIEALAAGIKEHREYLH